MAMAGKKLAPPTPLAQRYVRYVVGFGVAVGVGLAPFLGKVPGLDVLARLFPPDLKSTLIPFSAFLMGLIAVAIQYYSAESISRPVLRSTPLEVFTGPNASADSTCPVCRSIT